MYHNVFTPLDKQSMLRILPGLFTAGLDTKVLQRKGKVAEVIQGLFETGGADGGAVELNVK